MSFMVNTSPFAGREGKFVTSRNIKVPLSGPPPCVCSTPAGRLSKVTP
jgi:hypothetical protein